MKTVKTALLAGVLATVSTMAFAQTVAPTTGVDYRAVYGWNAAPDSYASADRAVPSRALHRSAARRHGRAYTTGSGVGSPD